MSRLCFAILLCQSCRSRFAQNRSSDGIYCSRRKHWNGKYEGINPDEDAKTTYRARCCNQVDSYDKKHSTTNSSSALIVSLCTNLPKVVFPNKTIKQPTAATYKGNRPRTTGERPQNSQRAKNQTYPRPTPCFFFSASSRALWSLYLERMNVVIVRILRRILRSLRPLSRHTAWFCCLPTRPTDQRRRESHLLLMVARHLPHLLCAHLECRRAPAEEDRTATNLSNWKHATTTLEVCSTTEPGRLHDKNVSTSQRRVYDAWLPWQTYWLDRCCISQHMLSPAGLHCKARTEVRDCA